MDVLHKVLKWIDYNRGLVIGLILAATMSIWLIGCDMKTFSPLDPDRKVTATELERDVVVLETEMDKRAALIRQQQDAYNADIAAMNKQIELAKADLERQAELRVKLIEIVGGIGTAIASGGLTAPAAIGSVIQVLTLLSAGGLFYDNRRKDRKIKNGELIVGVTETLKPLESPPGG